MSDQKKAPSKRTSEAPAPKADAKPELQTAPAAAPEAEERAAEAEKLRKQGLDPSVYGL